MSSWVANCYLGLFPYGLWIRHFGLAYELPGCNTIVRPFQRINEPRTTGPSRLHYWSILSSRSRMIATRAVRLWQWPWLHDAISFSSLLDHSCLPVLDDWMQDASQLQPTSTYDKTRLIYLSIMKLETLFFLLPIVIRSLLVCSTNQSARYKQKCMFSFLKGRDKCYKSYN